MVNGASETERKALLEQIQDRLKLPHMVWSHFGTMPGQLYLSTALPACGLFSCPVRRRQSPFLDCLSPPSLQAR